MCGHETLQASPLPSNVTAALAATASIVAPTTKLGRALLGSRRIRDCAR
jgi:hypothetical protein